MSTRLLILSILSLGLAGSAALGAAVVDEKFDRLTIGSETFTNATVLNKTRTDVFISHAGGMASLKVRDLDVPAQLKLGYQIEPPKTAKTEIIKQKVAGIADFESNPQVQAAEVEAVSRLSEPLEQLEQLDPRIFYGFIAAIILSYLSFSAMCRSICMKAAIPPKDLIPLVWVPLLKQLPLLKAAGMSPWWILTNFVPGLFVITYGVWSFKITKSRGKGVATAVFLLLPVVNVLAFLYLAFSSGAGEAEADNRKIISFQSSPRQNAA